MYLLPPLSTLKIMSSFFHIQLANLGNVTFEQPKVQGRDMESACRDGNFDGSFSLQLHNNARQLDIENYRAPSLDI